MALDFTGNTAARVDHGNPSALTNMSIGTIIMWVRPTSFSGARRWLQKGTGANFFLLWNTPGPSLEFTINRATSALRAIASISDLPAVSTGAEAFVAVSFNVNGTDSDQHIYSGNASTLAAEVATYSSQQAGSGAQGDNSADNLIVGNSPFFSHAFDGSISLVAIWNRQLTLSEIHAQQLCPHVTDGCVLFSHYLRPAANVQADWSATGADGTPTSCTFAATHAPVRFPRTGSVPSRVAGATGSTIVGVNLSDSLTLADTLVADTSIVRDQDEGDQDVVFSDEISFNITEDDGSGGLTITANLLDSFTFTEAFHRNPAMDRVLVG